MTHLLVRVEWYDNRTRDENNWHFTLPLSTQAFAPSQNVAVQRQRRPFSASDANYQIITSTKQSQHHIIEQSDHHRQQ